MSYFIIETCDQLRLRRRIELTKIIEDKIY